MQLHNALLVSLLDTSAHLAPPTPPPDVPKPPSRKRRRTLPYQGPDPTEMTTLRSERLKKWTVGLGRHERERIRTLEAVALNEVERPRPHMDEISAERGIKLLPEKGGAFLYSYFLASAKLPFRNCWDSTSVESGIH